MNSSPLGHTGLLASRLGLGTAEVGFSYGIGTRPLPTEDEAITLLQKAVDLGITFFDTANYYGEAEVRLGKSGILKDSRIIVETKCAQFLEKGEYFSSSELEEKIRAQVNESREKLGLQSLPIVMLHGPSREQIEEGTLVRILTALRSEGIVQHLGVSTRGEEPSLATIESGAFEVMQVAYSILDQRMAERVLPRAKEKNIAIVNRSVLLKGSLTPLREQLPEGLEPLKQASRQAEVIAKELGMDLPTLAIRFAVSNPLITTSLIGTNKEKNLIASVRATEAGPLPEDVVRELEGLAVSDPSQVDPAKWPKLS